MRACANVCAFMHACMHMYSVMMSNRAMMRKQGLAWGSVFIMATHQCPHHGHTSVSSPWPHISVLTMATQCPHHGHTVSLPWPLSVLTMATHQCPHHGHTKKGLLKRVCSRLHFGHKSTHNPGAHTNTHTHTHIYTHTQTKRLTKTRLQSFTFWPQEHT